MGGSTCVLKDDEIRCVRDQPAAFSKHEARSDRPAGNPIASRGVRDQTPFNEEQVSKVTPPTYAEADASD